jgi:hypothetical protein
MQDEFIFMPGGFAMGDDMELSKIYPGNLGHDVFVIKENLLSRSVSQFLPENSNDFIPTGLYCSLCHVKSLLIFYCV